MKKHLFLVLISVFLISGAFAQKNVIIVGKVTNNMEFTSVYLDNVLNESETASSEIDSKGNFKFEFSIAKTDFFKLRFDDNNFVFLLPIPGETITLEVNLEETHKPTIKGSSNSQLLYSALKSSNTLDEELARLTEQIEQKKKAEIRKMIKANPSSLACLFFIHDLDIEEDFETYKILADGLKGHEDNALAEELIFKVKSSSTLTVGQEVPEIVMNSPEGKEIKLSSLRGNYVLIDFWASWCGPCRAESPALVSLYKKYNKKGFEIYSVSLDATKADWEKAIEKDGLSAWAHVSDLKYWESAAGQAYNVKSIPFTVLIDKDGKMIAKGLRGEDLEKKLAEILK